MNKNSEKFLFEYLNNASPTGYEANGQKIWLDYIKPYIDTWKSDNYGTVYGIINPESNFRVIIEAHADEIGWRVNYITDKGLIYVLKNGGSDHVIAPSKRVNIQTDEHGVIRGVFGWPAIHTRTSKDNNKHPEIDNIFIDVGASSREEVLKMGINIGNPITFVDNFEKLNDKFYIGRALDNRIGGFCIAEVVRKIYENKIKLPFGLYIVNSVQEEVGLRGAQMITETIRPDAAIIIDVSHDTTTPMIDKNIHGEIECGKGPELTYAPAVHNKLLSLIQNAAKKNEIPFQRSASSRSTGTDTDVFAYSNGGVPSALVSLPLRYMHTTVEMAHVDDIHNVIALVYNSLLEISPELDLKYI
ncbi:MAG: M42 family metallopeptidase [Deltaproteobacteria bacterium]